MQLSPNNYTMKAGKTLLCIGAGPEQVAAIELGRRMGHRIVAVDGNPNAPGLKVANKGMVMDLRDVSSVIGIAREVDARCAVPVPLGAILTTVGAVNDALGWRGISFSAAMACTDKVVMRKKLASARVAQPICHNVYSYAEAKAIVHAMGLPVVVKPTHGSGSHGVALVSSDDELNSALVQAQSGGQFDAKGGILIESVLSGCEYGVDGVVVDRQCNLLSLRSKIISPLPYRVAIEYTGPIRLDDVLEAEVQKTMQAAVTALGLNDCVIHADIMIDMEKKVSVIEVSGRPSGFGLSLELLPACLGTNPIEQTIRMMLGDDFTFEPLLTRVGTLRGLFDRPGELVSVGDLKAARALPGVLSIHMPLMRGDEIPSIHSGVDWWRAGQAMLVAEDHLALEDLWLKLRNVLAISVISR